VFTCKSTTCLRTVIILWKLTITMISIFDLPSYNHKFELKLSSISCKTENKDCFWVHDFGHNPTAAILI
jgi:hypothetical protein